MKRKSSNNKTIFKYERSECPVCMDEMDIENRSATSPCMHEFCLECIGKWLTESSSSLCPLCKQSVKTIIYNIKSPKDYLKINFPNGFHNAWKLRNKTKNVLDNFENIMFKMYNIIRNFLFGKKMFESKILDYLFYFGPIQYRPKSCATNKYLADIEISENEDCWSQVEKIVQCRLMWLFSYNQAGKIIKEINTKKCKTFSKFMEVLRKYVDTVRYERLKMEIITFLQMAQDPTSYLEFYVTGRHEHVIYSKYSLHDEGITAAIITRIITSISFETSNIMITGYQISNINNVYGILEYVSSFDNIISHLSFASHYILLSTGFYSSNILRKADPIFSHISNSTSDFIRHCFREEELDHISQTLIKFEERLIFVEPLIVDDSILSEVEVGEVECHSDVFIELTDSDEDALEIVSVSQPVFDLTENTNSDDEQSIIISEEDAVQPPEKKLKSTSDSDLVDLNEAQFFSACDFELPQCSSAHLATTSSDVDIILITDTTDSHEFVKNSNQSESLFHHKNFLSDDRQNEGFHNDISDDGEPNIINGDNVDFIYQPRSVNDFYEYLMSKNLPSDI